MEKVEIKKYLQEKMKEYGSILFPLFDPPKLSKWEISPKEIGEIAYEASEADIPALLLGGSTHVTPEMIDKYAEGIKGKVKNPVILFPSNHSVISKKVDAVFL